jgi:hypothetical protein
MTPGNRRVAKPQRSQNRSRGVGFCIDHHALLWTGSAASVLDLHSFLPSAYLGSAAIDIDADGNMIGSADLADGSGHAIMWVSAVPEPAAPALLCLAAAPLLSRRRSGSVHAHPRSPTSILRGA